MGRPMMSQDSNPAKPDTAVATYAQARSILRVRLETLAVTKLELYFNKNYITSGTAFVYRYAKKYALITNWHMLTGIDPNTNNNLDRWGARPNRIEFYLNVFTERFGQFEIKPFSA